MSWSPGRDTETPKWNVTLAYLPIYQNGPVLDISVSLLPVLSHLFGYYRKTDHTEYVFFICYYYVLWLCF